MTIARGLRAIALALVGAWSVVGAVGCTAKVDAAGRPANTVWFDRDGGAHCPQCEPSPGSGGGETEAGAEGAAAAADRADKAALVKPYRNRCEAGHAVVWASEELPCTACDGAGDCPSCLGTATDVVAHRPDRPCPSCSVLVEGNLVSQGRCYACQGKGTVRHGEHGPGADGIRR
jgi:hypothetical protein